MSSWCENVIPINHTDPMMLEKFRAAFNENIVARTFPPLEENENQNTTINPETLVPHNYQMGSCAYTDLHEQHWSSDV